MTRPDSLRILHVVGGMNRGGIETWLMQILRNADRTRMAMDFVVHSEDACAYDEEARRLGARVIPCLSPRSPRKYAQNFRRILNSHGPFHVVHSHVHHFNGFVLRLAEKHGIASRVAHSHNDTEAVDSQGGLARQMYVKLSKYLIQRHATSGLGASRRAADSLFGSAWPQDPRFRTLMYSIDLAPYRMLVDRQAVRRNLGLGPGDLVLGHVGRFVEQKNHRFLIEIFARLAAREERARLVLVGEGPLRPEIEAMVAAEKLEDRVIFAGLRSDVPQLMRAAFDLFLLPSFHEGLGLVLVEAQAAGLQSLLSDVVPAEADVVLPLMNRLSLRESADVWARAALRSLRTRAGVSRSEALGAIEASPFNIGYGLSALESAYHD